MRRIEVFFYGLFMDQALLRSKGVDPTSMQVASLDGFQLRIGQRATLEPAQDGRVYGLLASLSYRDLDVLYSEPNLRDYRPEAVRVRLQNGQECSALCFNLMTPPGPAEHNSEYAARLRSLAQRLELPAEYAASIK